MTVIRRKVVRTTESLTIQQSSLTDSDNLRFKQSQVAIKTSGQKPTHCLVMGFKRLKLIFVSIPLSVSTQLFPTAKLKDRGCPGFLFYPSIREGLRLEGCSTRRQGRKYGVGTTSTVCGIYSWAPAMHPSATNVLPSRATAFFSWWKDFGFLKGPGKSDGVFIWRQGRYLLENCGSVCEFARINLGVEMALYRETGDEMLESFAAVQNIVYEIFSFSFGGDRKLCIHKYVKQIL